MWLCMENLWCLFDSNLELLIRCLVSILMPKEVTSPPPFYRLHGMELHNTEYKLFSHFICKWSQHTCSQFWKIGTQKLIDAKVMGWLAEASLSSSFFCYPHLNLCPYCIFYFIQFNFLHTSSPNFLFDFAEL